MNRILITTIALSIGANASLRADDANKAELEKFQGVWKAVGIEGSLPPEKIDGVRVTINGDKVKLEGVFKEAVDAHLKLDSTKSPKSIDIKVGEGKEDALLGIYEFDKDKLRVCYSEIQERKRPTDFTAKKDSKRYLWVLQQEKK